MHLGYLIFLPLFFVLWIYIALMVKNNLVANTPIEVKIIGHDDNGRDEKAANATSENSLKISALSTKVKHHVPKFMLELYEKNKSVRKSDAEADLVRSLIPAQTEKLNEDEVLEELSENHLLIFNIPTSAKEEKFMAAEMKVLTRIEIRSSDELGVKKMLKIAVFNEHTHSYSYHNKMQIHHFNDTWLSFNLTQEVREVLQGNSEEKLLKVIITVSALYHQSQNNLKLSILPVIHNFDTDHDYPILILSYSIEEKPQPKEKQIKAKSSNHLLRNRRNVDVEDYEQETNTIWTDELKKKISKIIKRNNCRRKPLYVDFAEIKYDSWIVQPTGYDAYQCHGKCFYPVADHLSPTKHAIMQALIHSVDASKASRSCCVPTVLDSISILYVDDRGVLTYRFAYKDMVVLECGCR